MGTITRTIANNLTTGLGTGGFEKLSGATTATNVSSVDLTLSTDYKIFKLVIDQVEPAVDGGLFRCRFSVDGGSSFISSSAVNYGGLTKAALGDQSDEGGAGVLEIIPNRSGLSNPKGNYYNYLGYRHDTSNTYRGLLSQGKVESSGNDIDAVRVYFDNGNIQTITYTLYGVKN